jgi:hypothetical protein
MMGLGFVQQFKPDHTVSAATVRRFLRSMMHLMLCMHIVHVMHLVAIMMPVCPEA